MRTLRLKQLVNEVLDQLPQPHTEDVIEDVFFAIEHNETWRKSYDRMVYESGKAVVNAWAGFWIAHAEKRVGDQRETAGRSTLIESYSKLVKPAEKRAKKVKEPEALKAMHDHYLANRESLPANIRDHREVIVALIMDGVGTEAAFAQALEKPAFAW
jgi:hypothetical protein